MRRCARARGPRSRLLRRRRSRREFWFAPGDDYELLLAIAPGRFDACADAARETGAPLFRIGQFTPAAGVLVLQRADGAETPLPGRGFDHFA